MENTPNPLLPDKEQSGMMFSWNFVRMSAILIITLTLLAAYRHLSMGIPLGIEDPAAAADTLLQAADSLQLIQ
jgi:hypothetical protein